MNAKILNEFATNWSNCFFSLTVYTLVVLINTFYVNESLFPDNEKGVAAVPTCVSMTPHTWVLLPIEILSFK